MEKEGSESAHTELDAHWVAVLLFATRSPLLKQLPWQCFVSPTQHVFQMRHVVDIGPYVRKLSLNRAISSDVMCRIIQYSLPYVKHNRLNFPRYKDMSVHVLVGLLQIVMVLVLGLSSKSSKKPVWQMRFSILIYMHALMTHGSQYDLYLFCMQNVNLVRIAVIEYFVYFVQMHMPCEFATLNLLFGTHCNVQVVFRQFCTNIDAFRVNCLQQPQLSWQELNEKAHYVIEKCNRICKSKPKIALAKCTGNKINLCFSASVLNFPRFKHILYCKIENPHMTKDEMLQVCFLHENVQFIRLPVVLQTQQNRAVLAALERDRYIYQQCMLVHVCFRCLLRDRQLDSNLRVDHLGGVFCNSCNTNDLVFGVNILGCIFRVFQHLYYLCHICLKVHMWRGTGSEFFVCPMQQHVCTKSSKQCQLCMRSVGINLHTALDSSLGVMQYLTLCQRHTPREFEASMIHNLHGLVECVRRKMTSRNSKI